jgi:hypothetical protein
MIEYGLKRGDHIEAFFEAIDWVIVNGRLGNPRLTFKFSRTDRSKRNERSGN